MSLQNNGKRSEKMVMSALSKIPSDQFDYMRLYDATSARNPFMAQTGDFLFFMPGIHGVIEVKSTTHPYRLRKSAFSDRQRVKLTQRLKAGGEVWVLVHHYMQGYWRLVYYQDVHVAFDEEGKSSMDLRNRYLPYPDPESLFLKAFTDLFEKE